MAIPGGPDDPGCHAPFSLAALARAYIIREWQSQHTISQFPVESSPPCSTRVRWLASQQPGQVRRPRFRQATRLPHGLSCPWLTRWHSQ